MNEETKKSKANRKDVLLSINSLFSRLDTKALWQKHFQMFHKIQ